MNAEAEKFKIVVETLYHYVDTLHREGLYSKDSQEQRKLVEDMRKELPESLR